MSILSLCNGVQNCDDCQDEVFENCMQVECNDGKPRPLIHDCIRPDAADFVLVSTCTCIVHVQFFPTEYVRCGNESGQCILLTDRCNRIQDCVNGWDENDTLCHSQFEQENFITSGKYNRKPIF